MEYNKIFFFIGIITIGMISQSYAHSYVTSPQSRSNQKQTQSGCRGPECLGPCDAPLSRSKGPVATYKRGDSVTVQWPRNNHAGGFIRFAWALTSNSDSAAAFDHGVQQINCHEVGGCGPRDASDPNGGDDGAGDGSYKPCQSTIAVPGNLADGAWTLQWAWFGGAFALGDYYSCIDVTVSGGDYSSFTPVFVGGDYSNPGTQKCKFFNTDKLHVCVSEPCYTTLSGQQTGIPAYIQLNLDGSIIPSINLNITISSASGSTSSTSGAKVSSTSSSSSRSTSTSSSSSTSSTSGTVKVSTSTSGRISSTSSSGVASSTSTSGTVNRPPTQSSTSTSNNVQVPPPVISTPSSNSCSVGQMKCVSSEEFAMCLYGTYGAPMRCATGTTCQPLGNVIQCGW